MIYLQQVTESYKFCNAARARGMAVRKTAYIAALRRLGSAWLGHE